MQDLGFPFLVLLHGSGSDVHDRQMLHAYQITGSLIPLIRVRLMVSHARRRYAVVPHSDGALRNRNTCSRMKRTARC